MATKTIPFHFTADIEHWTSRPAIPARRNEERAMINETSYYRAVLATPFAARAFLGSNGLWYCATEDERGFHAQGVGSHACAEDAIAEARAAWREQREEAQAFFAQVARQA